MSESAWVAKRRGIVEGIVNGKTVPKDLKPAELHDAFVAMRDEIKTLREHLNPTRRE